MARSRKKKRLKLKLNWKLLTVLGAVIVFAAAFIYYFASTFIVTEREYAVYTSMEEPTLPVIYAEVNDRDINLMHGYVQDMGNAAASDCITPLPENRRLSLKIKLCGNSVSGICYEIRSLDLGHFIEKTELDGVSADENGDALIELPIQNMIEYDTPYLLKLQLDLGESTVNYYTKIIWSQNDNIERMIETASDFTKKTFDYDAARDLTVYLETDPNADASSLSTVGISSSFSQITWGSTGMRLIGEPEVTVREYDGIMGAVEVSYTSESSGDSDNTDRYNNTDEFTMRAGSERIYMMNFQRKTDQIFEGNKHLFAGKRINLGIINDENIQTIKSDNSRYLTFKAGRDLWLYDQHGKKAVNIFSFRSENDALRSDYDRHDIKILSVDGDGNVDFVVYGYMNRGRHEGLNGIVYYSYSSQTQTISELFFIPRTASYEKIKAELSELCVKSSTGMFYIKQDDAITAIDLASQEMLDIASDMYGDKYAISRDQTRIAWTEGGETAENDIKLMDIESGNTQIIDAAEDEIVSVIDFYNQDLIYGISGANDAWIINGKSRGIPKHSIHIVNSELEKIMSYERDGLYFDDIAIDNDRIQITQYKKTGANSYQFSGRDTIVSSEPAENLYMNNVSTDISDTKKEVKYIDLDENIKTTRTLDVSAPENISYEKSGTLELGSHKSTAGMRYYGYANGQMTGIGYTLKEAIDSCYDDMGWVEDENSVIIYSRADRVSSKTIQEPFNTAQPLVMAVTGGDFDADEITEDGYIIMNAQGVQLNRLLYYVNKGCPVMANLGGDGYCLIYGYTADNVDIFYPSADDESISRTETMGLEDAALFFDRYQDDYIVFTRYLGK